MKFNTVLLLLMSTRGEARNFHYLHFETTLWYWCDAANQESKGSLGKITTKRPLSFCQNYSLVLKNTKKRPLSRKNHVTNSGALRDIKRNLKQEHKRKNAINKTKQNLPLCRPTRLKNSASIQTNVKKHLFPRMFLSNHIFLESSSNFLSFS